MNRGLTIIYLTLATLPGRKAHSVQIVRMCDSLARKGCRVYLLAPGRFKKLRILNTFRNLRRFYGVEAPFSVIPVIPPVLWTKNEKVNMVIHLLASALYAFICSIFMNFVKLFTRQEVFLFVRTPLLLAFLQALRPLNKWAKIIYECHDIDYEISAQGRLKPLFIGGLKNTALTICTTQFLSNRLKNLIGSRKTLITLYNAYDDRLFVKLTKDPLALRTALGLPKDKWIVAYVGQLWSWKKPEFIIDAFQFIKDEKIVLVFVGGPEQEIYRLKEYAKSRNVRNIIFKGFVRPMSVPSYLMAADCLIHYTPSTGLLKSYSPLKIFEYMAAGKPILAPKQPWIEEVLRDGENALLFDENSPRALAEKIELLKSNRELAERISRNAKRESVKYTYERRAEELIKVLTRL